MLWPLPLFFPPFFPPLALLVRSLDGVVDPLPFSLFARPEDELLRLISVVGVVVTDVVLSLIAGVDAGPNSRSRASA